MDDPLVNRITMLSREDTLEAALALAQDLAPGGQQSADPFVEEVRADPFAASADVEDLARALLTCAALNPNTRKLADEVVTAAGTRAFIFGGAEIVMLAGLGVWALNSLLSKGRKSKIERVRVKDGDTEIVYERETVYKTGPRVGDVMSRLDDAPDNPD